MSTTLKSSNPAAAVRGLRINPLAAQWTARVATLIVATFVLLSVPNIDGLLAFVLLCALTELSIRFGVGPLFFAIGIFCFPPGSIARSGPLFPIAWLLICVAPLLARPTSQRRPGFTVLALAPIVASLSIAGSPNAGFELVAVVCSLSLPIFALGRRHEFAIAALGCFSWIVALCSASYVISGFTGSFRDDPMRVIDLPTAFDWNVYFPFTPTVFGDRILGATSEFPRYVLFTPEPGLGVFAFATAITYFVSRRGIARALGLALTCVGALATQSLGLYLSLFCGLGAMISVRLWRAGKRGTAALALLGGLAAMAVLGQNSIEHRSTIHANTVLDRGLGGSSTLAVGNVNLLVGVTNYPVEALFLIVAILLVVPAFLRQVSPGSSFVLAATLVTAVFIQPIQWNFGVWLFLALSVVAYSDCAHRSAQPPAWGSGGAIAPKRELA